MSSFVQQTVMFVCRVNVRCRVTDRHTHRHTTVTRSLRARDSHGNRPHNQSYQRAAQPAHFRDNCDSDGLLQHQQCIPHHHMMCLSWISRLFYGIPPTRPPDSKPAELDFAAIHLGKYLEGRRLAAECSILESYS